MQINLKYVQSVAANNQTYWYFRYKGQRIRLPGNPGEVEFHYRYDELLKQHTSEQSETKERYEPGSVGTVIKDYKGSPEFAALAAPSKDNYTRYLDLIGEQFGRFPIQSFTTPTVRALRNKYQDTPGKANEIVKVLGVLMVHAIQAGLRRDNPCEFVPRLALGERQPWPDHVLAAVLKDATPTLRLAVKLHLYTGQRISDVVKMTHHCIRDGEIEVVQQKTGKNVWIPLHKELMAEIALTPKESVYVLYNRYKQPFTTDAIRDRLLTLMQTLGFDFKFHGLRKNAVISLLELGCSEYEVLSITGQSEKMVRHYAKQIRQRVLAQNAMKKWESGKKIIKKWQNSE